MKNCTPIVDNIFGAENIRNCQEYVISIQRRLDKAVADNDIKGIRETFDLLAKRTDAVKILATQRITQRNQGKYTAGVDGIAIPKGDRQLQNDIRLKLLDKIDIEKNPDAIKRVFIPKPNGKQRPLGIPTIQDRINQEILRIAIEPIVEYHFNDSSYGFRPKRSCHDAQEALYHKLVNPSFPRYILEGDIKGCFDNINHEHIISTLLEWQVPEWTLKLITKILKSNIFHNGEVWDSDTGTPQGGVISPLLANVALTTLDNFCYNNYGRINIRGTDGVEFKYNPIVRYADDFVIVCKNELQAKQIKSEISEHLKEKVGLTLSVEKTHITHITKGFNFLGFNFRKYETNRTQKSPLKQKKKKKPSKDKWGNYKLLIKPQKEKVEQLLRDCKVELDKNKTVKPNVVLHKINPKLVGWGMYYRFSVSKKVFNNIYHQMWWKLYRWAKRRHPNKSKGWIIQKYFTKQGKWDKVFYDEETQEFIYPIHKIPIKRYVLVRNYRVYDSDPEIMKYWNRREYTNAFAQIESVRISRLYKSQKGYCPYCNGGITQDDIKEREVQIHHMKPISQGGNQSYSNLRLIHSECHREVHATHSYKSMSELTDNGIDYINTSK
jgi:RNA-directed DNA polymerase